jgi:hypothetical protein
MIVALTAKHHLPGIYSVSEFTRSGGLIAYGIDRADLFYRSAAYVDRILKGEKAADLAVQQPTKFELAINVKTANGWRYSTKLRRTSVVSGSWCIWKHSPTSLSYTRPKLQHHRSTSS